MYSHVPVLINEIIESIITDKSGVYMDCTVGLGGHSLKIAEILDKNGILISMDLDPYALKMAKKKLEGTHNKIIFCNDSYLIIWTLSFIINIYINIIFYFI